MSESPSLAGRNPMTREQWRAYLNNHMDEDPRIVEFLSLQDLKGSQYFGGSYDKLRHIARSDWDLLVIDEAHEGIDTTRTDRLVYLFLSCSRDARLVRDTKHTVLVQLEAKVNRTIAKRDVVRF